MRCGTIFNVIKLLPAVLIILLITGGLIWWRFSAKQNLTSPVAQDTPTTDGATEVPKQLPPTPIPTPAPTTSSASSSQDVTNLNSRLQTAEGAVTELKARISALEKATPVPLSTTTKSTVYIPLGSGGSWGDQDWNSLAEYEVSLNPDNYPGYSNMNLEVIFRLSEAVGTASVRLYNTTDSQATSSQVDSTSTSFSLQTSSTFRLASGTKTYRLQVKSSQSKSLFIQSARIKVNF